MIARNYTVYSGTITPQQGKRICEFLNLDPSTIQEITFTRGSFTATSVSVEKEVTQNKPEVAP